MENINEQNAKFDKILRKLEDLDTSFFEFKNDLNIIKSEIKEINIKISKDNNKNILKRSNKSLNLLNKIKDKEINKSKKLINVKKTNKNYKKEIVGTNFEKQNRIKFNFFNKKKFK